MNWLRNLIMRLAFGKPLISDETLSVRTKSLRLAEIARERTSLKEQLEKAIKQKTRRVHIYARLDALKREEMALAGDLP